MGRKRIYDVDLIKKLYLEENKTIKQIADETGYKYGSIAAIISKEKISKHSRSSNNITDDAKEVALDENEDNTVNRMENKEPVILENKEEEKIEKPYEVLYDNFVFYKGRIYEILKGDELRDVLYPLLVKKKLPPKKKGRKCRSNYTSL